MGAIRICTREATPLVLVSDRADGDTRAKLNGGGDGTAVRSYHPGSDSELQMFELTVEPDRLTKQHAHDEDEIIFVLDGELRLGRRRLTAGASIYVPGGTLYSFRSGPEGLRFLNFRARRDGTYITKAEFMARRAQDHEAESTE